MHFRFFGPPVACWLAIAGLLPGFGLLLAAALHWMTAPIAIRALSAYAALVLAFSGAIRWGLAAHAPRQMPVGALYGSGVVGVLVGWGALQLPTSRGLALLLAGYLAQYLADYTLAHRQPGVYPVWLLNLRTMLTSGICIALILASAMLP
ncbi:MAG: DUF3429 family protein [Burkholderiales bacterium]|nr:DUF3429 family protein [Burkholderiales bacterium]